jgi:hypothetical protein
MYTREQLQTIRERNNVTTVEYKPGDVVRNRSAEFISSLTKRESAPPVCHSELQQWYDTSNWGYWYQTWNQVGNCFYCNVCTEGIAISFGVTETWTVGLAATFYKVLQFTFQFSYGEALTLTDTRTCSWTNVEDGCHSIWYQPMMSYHNGNANYQTHTHCTGGVGGTTDSYFDHNWAFANVNAGVGGDGSVNTGNMGCNSGCQGSDHRQCLHGNSGHFIWPGVNN